jgi:hypothetical protein
MPILNAAYTVYDSVYLPVPTETDPSSTSWTWGDSHRFIASNFNTKQIATFDFDTTTIKGDPRGTLWDVKDVVWQVDVSIPFLIPELTDDDMFPSSFSEPCCANLPLPDDVRSPLYRFLYAALRPKIGPSTTEANDGGMWDTFWNDDIDIIIQKLSVNVRDTRAMMDISLLCTTDPRSKFLVKQEDSVQASEISPMRAATYYDFDIPYGSGYLGSNIDYSGGYGGVTPERSPYTAIGNHGLVREWGFTVQSQVQRFKSAGTPSARPLLGISSTICEGRLGYIPITIDASGNGTIVNDDDRLPVGWMVDQQALENISRAGGRLFVAGQPPYTGNTRPIYLGMNMRKGNSSDTYSVISPDDLGPIGVAVASFEASAGSENVVNIDFKTLVGLSVSEFETIVTT